MAVLSTLKNITVNKRAMHVLQLLALTLLPGIADARNLTAATNTLCSKIKFCATAQMTQQQVPPAMLEMMTAMLDETCAITISPYADKATNAGLEKKAVACIASINSLSCSALMNTSDTETKECKALNKAANEAGINTNIQRDDIKITQ